MLPIDVNGELSVLTLFPSLGRTASANGTGVDISAYKGVLKGILNCSAATAGTNPTCDIKIQDSADNSSFADLSPAVAFTQVTDTAGVQSVAIDTRACRKYIRAVFTIGGTSSPAFTFGVVAVGQKNTVS